jgi:prolipoprotein diacylglyceryltransferase
VIRILHERMDLKQQLKWYSTCNLYGIILGIWCFLKSLSFDIYLSIFKIRNF